MIKIPLFQNKFKMTKTVTKENIFVTKVEYAALLTKRATEIYNGSQPLIQTTECNPITIAELEIRAGQCTFMITREFPNGKKLLIDPRKAHIPW